MELLNNIWNALTTPNEILINILSIPFTMIETTILMTLFLSILNINSNKKQKILLRKGIYDNETRLSNL